MKKKLLCALLCLVMVAAALAVPANATKAEVWSNKGCLELRASGAYYNTSHSTATYFTSEATPITTNSTVTLYMKLDSGAMGTHANQNGFPIVLINNYMANNEKPEQSGNTHGLAAIAVDRGTAYQSFGNGLFVAPNIATTQICINSKPADESTYQVKGFMNAGQWNRIDMLIDFENGTMTAYLNYTINLGTATLENADKGYIGLYFPFITNTARYGYVDNVMVRNGLNMPQIGDVASNLDQATVTATEGIIYHDTFDTITASLAPNGVYNPDAARWAHNTNDGVAPQNKAGMFRGTQYSAVDGNAYNVRFVGTLDSLNYDSAGFDITIGDKTVEYKVKNVYDSVTGGNGIAETYSALGTYGAGYIYAVTVTGLSTAETYTFTVKPFTYVEGVKTETGESFTMTYSYDATNGVTVAYAQ